MVTPRSSVVLTREDLLHPHRESKLSLTSLEWSRVIWDPMPEGQKQQHYQVPWRGVEKSQCKTLKLPEPITEDWIWGALASG